MDKSSPAVDAIDRQIAKTADLKRPVPSFFGRSQAQNWNRRIESMLSALSRAREAVKVAEEEAAQDQRDKLRAEVERLKAEGLLTERSRGCNVMEGK